VVEALSDWLANENIPGKKPLQHTCGERTVLSAVDGYEVCT
jgi:hypothetical protein